MSNKKSSNRESILVSDATAREDLFGRMTFAVRLADMIATHPDLDSIVFGLYGEWGSGKTTILEYTEAELRKNYKNKVVAFWFNPWRYHDEAILLTDFMNRLSAALDKDVLSKREKFSAFAEKNIAPLIPEVEISNVKVNFATPMEKIAKYWSTIDLETMKARVGQFLVDAKVRVAIFIDDIDRLDHTEIQTIFRLVKLTADFKNTAYVLAFDEAMAAQALSLRYGSIADDRIGSSFLEKIVQVPLRVPKISWVQLRRYCFDEIERVLRAHMIELGDTDGGTFGHYFDQAVEARLLTPRAAKRFANTLAFSLPLVRDDVNIVDFMLIEALSFFYPDVYRLIRDNPDIALSSYSEFYAAKYKEIVSEKVDRALEPLTKKERDGAEQLLRHLFPRMEGLKKGVSYGSSWEETWAKKKRAASRRFFDRYFAYAVPADDLSEQDLRQFVDTVTHGEVDIVVGELQALLAKRDHDNVLFRIGQAQETMAEEGIATLATALAFSSDSLSGENRQMLGMSPRDQAAAIIPELLAKIVTQKKRFKTAERIIRDAGSAMFALNVLRWIGPHKENDEGAGTPLFNDNDLAKLKVIIVQRIENVGLRAIFDDADNDESRFLLWAWKEYGNPERLKNFLKELIVHDGSHAIDLVKVLAPVATSLDTGQKHKSDFDQERYTLLKELIDPAIIFKAIRVQYGSEIDTPQYNRDSRDVDMRLAHQFAFVHLNAQSSPEEISASSIDPDNTND